MRLLLGLVLFALAALTGAVSSRAQDVPECHDPAYFTRFQLPGVTGNACVLVAQDQIRWNGHYARIRMIRLTSSGASDTGGLTTGLSAAAAAAGHALSQLGSEAMIDNVTILLGDAVSPAGAGGYQVEAGQLGAWTPMPVGGDCPIYMFKAAAGRDRDYGIDTIIHELFHCVQHRLWGTGTQGEAWLTEGSAEYFVYLARPARKSQGIDHFDQSIATTSMGAMSYQAVPYFLWLGDSEGPPAVLRRVSRPQPIAAMIEPARWRNFGKAYFDNRIHLPGGVPIPSHPMIDAATVSAATRLQFASPAAFTLKARDITFKKPKSYDLAFPPAMPEGFQLWRGGSGADWGDPPAKIAASCSDKRFRAIWGNTAGSDTTEASVTAQNGQGGECTCPVGIWRETSQSAERYFEQSGLGVYAGGAGKRWVTGRRTLVINGDHTGSLSYDGIEVITGEGTDLVLDQVQSGQGTFTWKVVGGRLLTVWTNGSGKLTLNNTLRGHGGARHETRQAAMQSIGHEFTCDQNGLHLTVQAHVPSYMPAGMTSGFSPAMDFQPAG